MGYIAYPVASQGKQGGLTLLDETAALKEYNTGDCKRDGQTVYVLTYPRSEYIEVTKSDLQWALLEIEKYEAKQSISNTKETATETAGGPHENGQECLGPNCYFCEAEL